MFFDDNMKGAEFWKFINRVYKPMYKSNRDFMPGFSFLQYAGRKTEK